MRKLNKFFIQNSLKARLLLSVLFCLIVASFFVFGALSPALAQDNNSAIDPVAENFGLNTNFSDVAVQTERDIKSIIGLIINIALGFLGIIAVLLILYAGYMWMTAAGNEDQIAKAKLILRNAVIGLVIIFSAWAIASFIINQLSSATGSGRGGVGANCSSNTVQCSPDSTNCDQTQGLYCSNNCTCQPVAGPGLGGEDFAINSFSTIHEEDAPQNTYRCSAVKAQFNHWVGSESFTSMVQDGDRLKIAKTGETIAQAEVAVSKRNNIITFKNTDNDKLWDANASYDVFIGEELKNYDNDPLKSCKNCTDSPSPGSSGDEYFKWSFTTGERENSDPMTLAFSYPQNQDMNVPRYVFFRLEFSAEVDADSVLDEDEKLIVDNIKLQQKVGDQYFDVGSKDTFDARVDGKIITFNLNNIYYPGGNSTDAGLLSAYSEYKLTVSKIKDLCDTEMSGTVEINFTTGADSPGISYVYPNNDNSCVDVKPFVMFGTSMYNIRTNSCAVDEFNPGNGGFVLSGRLSPSGAFLKPLPDDNFSGAGNPSDLCKKYSFNLDNQNLIADTEYSGSILYLDPSKGERKSNPPWNFTIKPEGQCANAPYITRVSPNNGKWGRCLTVYGNYFEEDKTGANTVVAQIDPIHDPAREFWENPPDLNFPSTGDFWDNGSIRADFLSQADARDKIPSGSILGFKISVKVDKTDISEVNSILESNPVSFMLDTSGNYQGPCLDSISPSFGPWGETVDLAGRNFSKKSSADHVLFASNKIGQNTQWISKEAIKTKVPNNAIDGLVFVKIGNDLSNGIDFNVSAGAGQSCSSEPNPPICSPVENVCDDGLVCSNACICERPQTPPIAPVAGQFQIQNPQPYCNESCVSAEISFEATHPLNQSTLSSNTFIKQCPPSSSCDIWNNLISVSGYSVAPDGLQRAIISGPDRAPNTCYRVALRAGANGLRSQNGDELASGSLNFDMDADGQNDSYSWKFCTGSASDPFCKIVDRISISPRSATIYGGYDESFSLSAYSAPNSCSSTGQRLDPAGLTGAFSWQANTRTENGTILDQCFSRNTVGDITITKENAYTATSTVANFTGANQLAWMCARYTKDAKSATTGSSVTLKSRCSSNAQCVETNPSCSSTCNLNTGICNPKITGFTPLDGSIGTLTTINGCYFGNRWGEVDIGLTISGHASGAIQPSFELCLDTWSDRQIIAEVGPNTQASGPVLVKRTDNAQAQSSVNFTFDSSIIRPGVCSISPQSGRTGTIIDLKGKNFGSFENFSDSQNYNVTFTKDGSIALSREIVKASQKSSCPENGWSDNHICIKVVDSAPIGNVSVRVKQEIYDSNDVGFEVLETYKTIEKLKAKSYTPGPGNLACLNMIVQVVLNGDLNENTVNQNTFAVRKTETRENVEGQISIDKLSTSKYRLVFLPEEGEQAVALDPSADYEIMLTTGASGIQSVSGGDIERDGICADMAGNTCVIGFTTVNSADQKAQCYVDHLLIEPQGTVYTCAHDECDNDFNTSASGHQREFTAELIAKANQPVQDPELESAQYQWTSSDSSILDFYGQPSISAEQIFTIQPKDDTTNIKASISGTSISGSTEARVFLCANPWPPTMAQDGVVFNDSTSLARQFTSKDIRTNFSTFYCKDRAGDREYELPDISSKCAGGSRNDKVCSDDNDCPNYGSSVGRCVFSEDTINEFVGRSSDYGMLLKDFLFIQPKSFVCKKGETQKIGSWCAINENCNSQAQSDGQCAGEHLDAIGIQVLPNPNNDTVADWHNSQESLRFGNPKSIDPIDGFDALQDGRTFYVSALNDTQGPAQSIYNNIYLMSVSNGANKDTMEILNQMINNWRFLVNIDSTQRQKLERDRIRIQDMFDFSELIESANPAPDLSSGSNLGAGLSRSTESSWKDALENDFGTSLAVDPINKYACTNTKAYVYEYRNQAGSASFLTNLEYASASKWDSIPDIGWKFDNSIIPPNQCMDNPLQYVKQ